MNWGNILAHICVWKDCGQTHCLGEAVIAGRVLGATPVWTPLFFGYFSHQHVQSGSISAFGYTSMTQKLDLFAFSPDFFCMPNTEDTSDSNDNPFDVVPKILNRFAVFLSLGSQ